MTAEPPRSDRTRRVRRTRALAALAVGMLGALTPLVPAVAAAASTSAASTTPPPVGFGQPYQIAAPANHDVIPVVLGFSAQDTAAAAFGSFDEDEPGISQGALSLQTAGGTFAHARRVPGSQRILSLAYRGSALELLVGTSPHVQEFGTLVPCCSKVEAVRVSPRGVTGLRHTVIAGLNGATRASLVPAQGRLLAAVATEEGIWAAQSDTHGRFGHTRALAVPGSFNEAMAATSLSGGRTIVVWTARASQFAPGPITIFDATGSPARAPQTPAVAINVPPTHEIDELAVTAHGSVPTVAWIESWFDSTGAFHSQAYAEDLAGAHAAQAVSPSSVLASGLALASAPGGQQILAFRACVSAGSCTLDAALRGTGRFGSAAALGPIAPAQTPSVAEGPTGAALVGWVTPSGNVDAATATAARRRFRAPYRVSSTGYAADLAVAYAPSGASAIVVWTQGTLNESIVGATYTAPPVPKQSKPKPRTKTPTKT